MHQGDTACLQDSMVTYNMMDDMIPAVAVRTNPYEINSY